MTNTDQCIDDWINDQVYSLLHCFHVLSSCSSLLTDDPSNVHGCKEAEGGYQLLVELKTSTICSTKTAMLWSVVVFSGCNPSTQLN